MFRKRIKYAVRHAYYLDVLKHIYVQVKQHRCSDAVWYVYQCKVHLILVDWLKRSETVIYR